VNIHTTRFGVVGIKKEKIIEMPNGLLGFPDNKQFVMLPHEENSPFFWYQSIDEAALAFVLTSPFIFKPDYEVDLEDTVKEMSWNENGKKEHLELFVIVNIPKGSPHKISINLIGPILINTKTRQAVQMVLSNGLYSHKFPLITGK
jgi:flagellar assembly factor FliW